MKKVILFGFFILICFSPLKAEEQQKFIVITIENIGRPYTVIEGKCLYVQFPSFSISGDPLERSVDEAFKKMQEIAIEAGADALFGFDIDFNSRPMKG